MLQSPIDIVGATVPRAPCPKLELNYLPVVPTLEHNDWTVQIDMPEGSTMKRGEEIYDLVQFHFHEPSEHYIEGKRFALEVHFVHRARSDNSLAIVAVMVDAGKMNPLLAIIAPHMPREHGEKAQMKESIHPADLLPTCLDHYHLMGSLTTPPYSEKILWLILTTPIEISAARVKLFHDILRSNARPLQELKNRDIFICMGDKC